MQNQKKEKNFILAFLLILGIPTASSILYAQADPVSGFAPRLLTRGKLWGTFRNNGLQGGGNTPRYQSHDQTTLEYPGNAGRAQDFMVYWLDIAAVLAEAPNILDVARVCNPQNARGVGLWFLGIGDGADTLVSYSGPRDVTNDVVAKRYPVSSSIEASLGDSTGANFERSNYSPYHNDISGNEPVEIHNYRHGDYIINDEFPEEIILSQWENKLGLAVTRKAYAWSYQDFDDIIIEEIIFENTGSKVLTETFITFMNSFSVASGAHQWARGNGMSWSDWRVNRESAQDDWLYYTKATNYTADNPESTAEYSNLVFCYQRDDDWIGTSYDDTGQPFESTFAQLTNYNEYQGQVEGQLMGYQYIGFGPLDVQPPFINDPDENYVSPETAEQPFNFRWWKNGDSNQEDYEEPTYRRQTDAEMYRMVLGTSAESNTDNPDSSMLVTHSLAFGPYTLNPGEKGKVVIAFAAGSGADWHNLDELTWSKTQGAKDQLKDGEHSIIRNFTQAQFAYNMGFDLPDPPPDVKVNFNNSSLGQMVITWDDDGDDATDPDYTGAEASDVAGYRVYRAWPPSFDWHYGPWELVADIPLEDVNYYDQNTGKYTFTDSESFAGYNYYYNVRTYDTGHDSWIDIFGNDHGSIPSLESGYAAPEQKNMIAVTPFQPAGQIYDEMGEQIRIVPNPYRLDFSDPLHMYPDVADPYKIRFINLPKHCMIRIYSASGDMVYESEHQKNTAAETAWRQSTITFSGRVVSGIYFWVVESLDPASTGKIQKGTLAVVK